jgi:hypothetical protein
MSNNRINYSEFFRNRFELHDAIFNNLVEQSIEFQRTFKRRKRNFNEAFIQIPPLNPNNVVPQPQADNVIT